LQHTELQAEQRKVYIGYGANRGEPIAQIRAGLNALASYLQISELKSSSLYRTRAVGPLQDDYYNGVASFNTHLAPLDLLDLLQEVEAQYGRDRARELRWGPRTLDLDLLLYGEMEINCERLQVPHPRLTERAFVLAPLVELAPELNMPGELATPAKLLRAIDQSGLLDQQTFVL